MKLNKERILDNFRAMIRIRTVSEESSADEQAFAAFRALLRERYPAVFAAGESWLIGKRGVLIRIPGKTADHPSVLMAHYDVVPADASGFAMVYQEVFETGETGDIFIITLTIK